MCHVAATFAGCGNELCLMLRFACCLGAKTLCFFLEELSSFAGLDCRGALSYFLSNGVT
jgi:hypothetical protein